MKLMLAGKVDFSKLRYPVYASWKYDGIRAVMREEGLFSRTEKLIPNQFIQNWARNILPDGWEGELLLNNPVAPYRQVASAVMSRDGEPNFLFMVFDICSPAWEFIPFAGRYQTISKNWDGRDYRLRDRLRIAMNQCLETEAAVRQAYDEAISLGYEGLMLRDPNGHYRRGRASSSTQELLKMKEVLDEEATVLSVYEETMCDGTSRKKNRMGGFVARFDDGATFGVGTGFVAEERDAFWQSPDLIVGKRVTIKYQPPREVGQAPRFPVFKGIRHD